MTKYWENWLNTKIHLNHNNMCSVYITLENESNTHSNVTISHSNGMLCVLSCSYTVLQLSVAYCMVIHTNIIFLHWERNMITPSILLDTSDTTSTVTGATHQIVKLCTHAFQH